MISLWDTTGNEVVKALAAERRSAGGVASGMALSLIVVVDEKRVREAEAAATIAAAAHPCRLLIVVRSDIDRPTNRLDAEIVVGGRLGPCEAVVMRMSGRLALHAESVVMPLLVPDVPVVTWWHGEPPERIAHDFLGVVADRRITDAAQAADPTATLRCRADDYAPGDTDLAWTRITPWRTLVAGAFDTTRARVTGARLVAPPTDPTAALMSGWLASRLGVTPVLEPTSQFPRLRSVALTCDNGDCLTLTRENGTACFSRSGESDRILSLPRRPLGDELAEELRRLDADQIYADALGALTGITGLDDRPPHRVHVWKDPVAEAEPPARRGSRTRPSAPPPAHGSAPAPGATAVKPDKPAAQTVKPDKPAAPGKPAAQTAAPDKPAKARPRKA